MARRGKTAFQRGLEAEKCAAAYLERRGFRILRRNYRTRRGEIDIIAQDGDILVFVEVRCRTGETTTAAATIDRRKIARITNAARIFLLQNPFHQCRFDVICLDGDPCEQSCLITYLPEAFDLNDASVR